MRSSIQEALLVSLASVLKPLVRLMLLLGVGYREFDAIARGVFVDVASVDYGIRGRPSNMSRVSAITGISRKEVSRLRDKAIPRLSRASEVNPAAVVLHYWHHDGDFCHGANEARPLPFQGPLSFSALVGRYGGDIPPGAMRAALLQAGTVEEVDGLLIVRKHFFYPTELDDDFVRRVLFSISNLASTVVHNTRLRRAQGFSEAVNLKDGFLERFAWAEHLSPEATWQFRDWVRREGGRFLENADVHLGENETPRRSWSPENDRFVGVGLYYFEEERE
jgi:hypothetical protein